MRSRNAVRFGVLIVLALVLPAMSAAPVGARRERPGKVWTTHTCAEAWGTNHLWDTSNKEADTYGPLILDPDNSTACIDLFTEGGDFTVTFEPVGARVETFYASVRDSVPGSFCGIGDGWNETGEPLTITEVPASTEDACGEAVRYPDEHPELALYVAGDFKGRKVGSLKVNITYQR